WPSCRSFVKALAEQVQREPAPQTATQPIPDLTTRPPLPLTEAAQGGRSRWWWLAGTVVLSLCLLLTWTLWTGGFSREESGKGSGLSGTRKDIVEKKDSDRPLWERLGGE